MKNSNVSFVAAAALLAALAAPAFAQNIAIVNGKPVPTSRMKVFEQQLERAGRPMTDEIKAQIKEELITRELLTQAAEREGMAKTDDYKNGMELARQTVLVNALRNNYAKQHPVTDAEAKAEYDKVAATQNGEEFLASHILVEGEKEAKDLIAKIKQGGKFEELAKQHSKDPGSGANGGSLGWASAGTYVPEFSAAMAKLSKGQMTDAPVKSQFGWHIIRVDDKRKAESKLPPFEQVKPQIVQQLEAQKLAEYEKGLREKARIE